MHDNLNTIVRTSIVVHYHRDDFKQQSKQTSAVLNDNWNVLGKQLKIQ